MNGHNPLAGLAYVRPVRPVHRHDPHRASACSRGSSAGPRGRRCSAGPGACCRCPTLRLLHFLLMFLYIAFAIHHVYSAVLFDIEEHNGELSCIITGYKANVLEGELPRDDPRRAADDRTTAGSDRPAS